MCQPPDMCFLKQVDVALTDTVNSVRSSASGSKLSIVAFSSRTSRPLVEGTSAPTVPMALALISFQSRGANVNQAPWYTPYFRAAPFQ